MNAREQAQLEDAVAAGMRRAMQPGADVVLNSNLLRRISPAGISAAAFPGMELGATISCLRYMPRTPPGVIVECPSTAYSITLDPHQTAPNAVVGVAPQGGRNVQEYVYLRPGETIEVPGGVDQFSVFNADQAQLYVDPAQPNVNPLGFCAFLLGTAPGVKPYFPVPRCHPFAATIQAGAIAVPPVNTTVDTPLGLSNGNPLLGFSCGGLQAISVAAIGRDATGTRLNARWGGSLMAMFLMPGAVLDGAANAQLDQRQTFDNPQAAATSLQLWATPEVQYIGSRSGIKGAATGSNARQPPLATFEVPRGALFGQIALTTFTDMGAGGFADMYFYIMGHQP